jgi:hypothetical protein
MVTQRRNELFTDPAGAIASTVNSTEFEAAYGESFAKTLDLDTWSAGEDLLAAYAKLDQEVGEALRREDDYRAEIRNTVFPQLKALPYAPSGAGVYTAQKNDIEKVHRGLLFNGGVEACDGTSVVHDTLPLTITQIGVCLVSYNGNQGAWTHRLFRRDLRSRQSNLADEVLTLLERREKRESQGQGTDSLSELARRGIMTYAERAILKDKSQAIWRMGHGSPVPYELITGLWSSQVDRIRVSLDLIRWYVLEHKRFVFVPSAPRKRHWLMIGNALRPLEYAVIQTLRPEIEAMLATGNYRDGSGVRKAMEDFCNDVGDKIVVGLFRVWEAAPPYLFYAHIDHVDVAAHLVMADSVLQEHRGFPMLIDLADTVCTSTFGADVFMSSVQMAYADAGKPFQYMSERETRAK